MPWRFIPVPACVPLSLTQGREGCSVRLGLNDESLHTFLIQSVQFLLPDEHPALRPCFLHVCRTDRLPAVDEDRVFASPFECSAGVKPENLH
ncbi:hypothetical protein CEXT_558091 [Caerostris extrusa]|uniref:Uncharacterized protein n=1 Tax=Caerostris extrusa TaxID=172846 RepID=A0AAV4RQZ9_CAEEX|nr:hypothetical protein CEXT_558091 [Caerostris extrusa]